MTSLRNNEYRGQCSCGYQSAEASDLCSQGIVASGPFNYRFGEPYTGLRLVTRNVICQTCGTFHQRCHAIAETSCWPYLTAIALLLTIGWLIATSLSTLSWIVFSIVILAGLLLFGVRLFNHYNSKQIMARYANWVQEIGESTPSCPNCKSIKFAGLKKLPRNLPCPSCGERQQHVIQTYKLKIFAR